MAHSQEIKVAYQKIKATTFMENTVNVKRKYIFPEQKTEPVKSCCEGNLFLSHLVIDADSITLSEECWFRNAPLLNYCNSFVWTSAFS